jgi:inosine-uridine nucleoside N-ribohydrolase
MGGSQVEEWILPEDADDENRAAAPTPRRDAIEFLADELRAGPRVLLPTAPVTTLAAFLQTHPELANRIVRIVTMGGWFVGDGRASEFNILTDPTAAAIVYASGIPMAIAPLEMTIRARLFPSDIVDWKDLSPAGQLFFDGTIDWLDQMKRVGGEAVCCLHDPLAAGYLRYPELFETKGIVPAVDEATGRTEIVAYDESSPIRLIVDYDVAGFKSRFLETMRRVLS